MLEFSEYTIYGDNSVMLTDGFSNSTLEDYCKSLSLRINWWEFPPEDDMVAIVRLEEDGEFHGALFPGERIISMWLDDNEWKTGKNTTY